MTHQIPKPSVSKKSIKSAEAKVPEQPVQTKIKPEPKTNWKLIFILCIILSVIGISYYLSISQNDRDQLNQVLSGTGIIPWSERAETAVRVTSERSKDALASSIINITHPTAVEPKLDSCEVSSNGDVITVFYNCTFKGGLLGTPYKLKLKWSFSETQNFGVALIEDDTLLGVMPDMMNELNNYFQTNIYPVILGNAK